MPPVCSQISGPGRFVMRLRVGGVVVLVRLPRIRRLALEAGRDRVIRARILRIDVRRAHDHLGAERPQRIDLFLRLLIGRREDALVALDDRRDREAHAGVAGGAFDDRAARPQLAGLLGVLDHLDRHPVLDRVARIGRFDLGVDVRGDDALRDAVEAHERRIADRFENVVVDWSGHRAGTSCQTIIHAPFCSRWQRSCCSLPCTCGRCRRRRDTGRASRATAR